jgi:phosphate transport system permease protein
MANPAFSRPDMSGPQPVAATNVTSAAVQRQPLLQTSSGEVPDRIFKIAITVCGLAVLGVLVLIVYELVSRSNLSWHAFGLKFFAASDWDPVNEQFGALPFIYGTLVSSLVALVIAVPLAVGVAVFTTEMCPKGLRGPLSFFVELLAAIPSVIYGLWAIFVLVPLLSAYVQPFLAKTFGWTGLFSGPPYGIGMLAAGIILAIMIVPIISSITRSTASTRGRSGAGRDTLGDDSYWCAAQRTCGHCWGNHPWAWARTGRNDGRHHGHRKSS